MSMNLRKTTVVASTMLLLLLASVGGQAATNINATTSAQTSVSLGAGTYQISWVGTAGGGLYDAWQYNTSPSGNFRNAFTMTIGSSGTSYTYDVSTPNHYANYSTALAALSAFQSATSFDVFTTVGGTTSVQTVSTPTFTLTSTSSVSFGVPDSWFADNTGGVSIAVTLVPANGAPEPASYTLALAGLAAAVVTRRRALKR